MNLLVTCALPLEFNEARNQLKLKEITSKQDIPRVARGKNITLIYTGIGKLNSKSNLKHYIQNNKAELIIDTGTCGSLTNKYNIHDIVTSICSFNVISMNKKESEYIQNKNIISRLIPNITIDEIKVSSIDKTIENEKDKKILVDFGGTIVSWETATVFEVAKMNNIPFLSIRGVTDHCDRKTRENFKNYGNQTCKILYNYLNILCKGI